MCSIDNVYISSCPYYRTTNLGGASATILDPVSKTLKERCNDNKLHALGHFLKN